MENEAKHDDKGKPGLQYILGMIGLIEVANVGDWAVSSGKYERWNYRKGMPWMDLCGSSARHLSDFIKGLDKDGDSGLHPIAHMVFDGLMILDYVFMKRGTDDRYKELSKTDSNLAF